MENPKKDCEQCCSEFADILGDVCYDRIKQNDARYHFRYWYCDQYKTKLYQNCITNPKFIRKEFLYGLTISKK